MDLMKVTKEKQKMVENEAMVKNKEKGRGGKRSNSEMHAMKVVYISTPMKVKTSASKFMKIVQELTGRESDVVRIMETFGGRGRDTWMVVDHDDDDDDHHHYLDHGVEPSLVVDDGSSPSCSSEELVDHHHFGHHGVLERKQEESGPFDCNLLFDHQFSFHFDQELGNY